jgi:hypothetical protein
MSQLEPIGELMGEPPKRRSLRGRQTGEPVFSRHDQLVLELIEFGVSLRKAEYLVTTFPEERVRRQIEWLPLRAARRPASLLIASIEHDYEKPAYADE